MAAAMAAAMGHRDLGRAGLGLLLARSTQAAHTCNIGF
jgi:hypothetical protein